MVCYRWFEASAEYFSKAKIVFAKICLSDELHPGELFVNTMIPYENLELKDIVLCQAEKFFEIIGKHIKKVALIALDITENQFCSILSKFNYLTELVVEKNSPLFMAGRFLESEENRVLIKKNMLNLKVLSLQSNPYLSDAILMRIIKMTSELESLNLSDCNIAFHHAIQKRFYPQNLENTPSENLLTLKYIVKAIESQAYSISYLNLSDTLVDGAALSTIAMVKGLQLKRLILKSCRQLNLNGFQSFICNQIYIVELDLSNCEGINDSCVRLLQDLSQLQILKLRHCWKLTDETSKILAGIKSIKVLDLSNCVGISSNGIKDNLVNLKNESLHELYLSSIDLYENCVIQCSENLPNLRVFDVGNCCNGVTDKSLAAIIKNQVLLRKLNLQSCHLITDGAITGCDLNYIDDNLIIHNDGEPLNQEFIDKSIPSTSHKLTKISLRSKAEQQIVLEAERAKAMVSLLNKNINIDISADCKPIGNLKGLELLNLSGCTKISDISLKYGIKFHELKELYISNCQQISIKGIECLTTNCKSVEILDLSYCRNLNQESIDIIQQKLKRLRILKYAGCTLD
ncbi:F-box/LRR-repeat protein 2-like isoform X2 [Condylostylus longicornis]|nr:F-box/LRR-repeat protein 2-like isoform X2 [Condylostylus longicornis]